MQEQRRKHCSGFQIQLLGPIWKLAHLGFTLRKTDYLVLSVFGIAALSVLNLIIDDPSQPNGHLNALWALALFSLNKRGTRL